MNERILEIMNLSMESTGVAGLGRSYKELNPEKFSELIIRECCKIFVQLHDKPIDLAVLDVKKYFGIM